MINYKDNKIRYKTNELGSLYIDEEKLATQDQPIIYIGGQMEHRGHIIEQNGYTSDLNHNMYTGSWMYDYPTFSDHPNYFNALNFSRNLLIMLQEARLRDVILVTNGFGGMIAANASKSDLVDKIICVHPPFLGTPLANPDELEQYKHLFNLSQKFILKFLKHFISTRYGFQKDNYQGIDLRNVNLDKLIVAGSCLDENSEKNKILLETYKMIRAVTGKRSDGVVIFEPEIYEKFGINYLQTEHHTNHFDSTNPQYVENIVKKVLKK